MLLLGDKFFLFKKLDKSLWLELVWLNLSILNRGCDDFKVIKTVLRTLSSDESIGAFLEICQISTRQAIVDSLTKAGSKRLDKLVTKASTQRLEEIRKNPQDENHIMAAKTFLLLLEEKMRTCYN